MEKEHNKSKRHRLNKKMLRIMRDPQKRDMLIRYLTAQNTPLRNMMPKYLTEVK